MCALSVRVGLCLSCWNRKVNNPSMAAPPRTCNRRHRCCASSLLCVTERDAIHVEPNHNKVCVRVVKLSCFLPRRSGAFQFGFCTNSRNVCALFCIYIYTHTYIVARDRPCICDGLPFGPREIAACSPIALLATIGTPDIGT